MKKSMLAIAVFLIVLNCYSQNVGIGTTNPSEKLDVNGNLNVFGRIKINNVAGQNGQVLMTSPSGSTTWGSPLSAGTSDYKNIKMFVSDGIFIVPAGVTRLFVQMWGAGGGGADGGGGGGGLYLEGFVPISPGNGINVTIGIGGGGATLIGGNGGNGGTTYITVDTIAYYAWGGWGASDYYSGQGAYILSTPLPTDNDFLMGGESGLPSTQVYSQYSATQFVTSIHFGRGGNAANTNGTAGSGGFRSFYTGTASNISMYLAAPSANPGGGGGGGNYYGGTYGGGGAKGMAIFRW